MKPSALDLVYDNANMHLNDFIKMGLELGYSYSELKAAVVKYITG